MSGDRLPPKTASWLLRRLGWSRNNDVMLGDLYEQFARGKSRLWFWQEVFVAIIAEAHVSLLSIRSSIMKRACVWIAVFVAVFSLGYWTARNPFLVHEEMPSADFIAEQKVQRDQVAYFRRARTVDFLKMEVA